MSKAFIGMLAIMLAFSGCSMVNADIAENRAVPSPAPVDAVSEVSNVLEPAIKQVPDAFADGNNSFGFHAASLLIGLDENLALSPVSLEIALLMAQAGAVDETAEQMKAALSVTGMSDSELLNACTQMMARANMDGMEAANSIWMDEGYEFSQEYIDVCTVDFLSDAYTVDLDSKQTMRQINDWASDKTHGRIDEINEQPLPRDTVLALVNALYFLGEWAVPFEGSNTRNETFAAPSREVEAQMMRSTREVPYYHGDDFDMISLDFESEKASGGFAMAFLLPREGGTVQGLLGALDGEAFAGALAAMRSDMVKIKLPKFEFMFGSSFRETLQSLGMERALDANAQFDKMTSGDNDLFISDVLHKCYIRVDELGAEAAAVTEVLMARGASPEQDAIEFYADKPFLFAIYGKDDGMIYFLGAVNNPLKE